MPEPHLLQRGLGAALPHVDLVGRRLLRHQDENVGESIFHFAARLRFQRREQMVDFGVTDVDAAFDLALAQPLDRDLVTDVGAVFRVRNALALHRLAEVFGGELVVLGDAHERALDLRVVDANAGVLGVLHEHAFGDEPFEQLLFEDVP